MTKPHAVSLIQRQGYHTYFIAEGDGDFAVRKHVLLPANPCCNCYSVAKAFTVTAIGMLCDQGLLSVKSYMADILCAYLPDGLDDRWKRVTVHDLLLHKVGFDRGRLDIDVEDASQFGSDYLANLLQEPLAYEPGTVAQYTDAAYYLLSRIVAQVSGCDPADFLRPTLMNVMQFKEFAWSVCPQGYSMGATGLYLRTEDMVKLGMVYMNGGVWKDVRILSQTWVDTVLAEEYEFKRHADGWYGKSGMYGQVLMFHPDQKRAVACHSYDERMCEAVLIKNGIYSKKDGSL